jgi:hypothetical protein
MFSFLKDLGLPGYIVGIITLVTFGYKKIKEAQDHKLKSTKEQLELLIQFFSDENNNSNKFLTEQYFQYKFRMYIPASVIHVLLQTENPTSSFQEYIDGRKFLKCEINDREIYYKNDKMSNKDYRKGKVRNNIIGYFVFAYIGLSILFYLPAINKNYGLSWFVPSIPLSLYLLWVAYEFMKDSMRIKAAETLINGLNSLERHNNRVNSDG